MTYKLHEDSIKSDSAPTYVTLKQVVRLMDK